MPKPATGAVIPEGSSFTHTQTEASFRAGVLGSCCSLQEQGPAVETSCQRPVLSSVRSSAPAQDSVCHCPGGVTGDNSGTRWFLSRRYSLKRASLATLLEHTRLRGSLPGEFWLFLVPGQSSSYCSDVRMTQGVGVSPWRKLLFVSFLHA